VLLGRIKRLSVASPRHESHQAETCKQHRVRFGFGDDTLERNAKCRDFRQRQVEKDIKKGADITSAGHWAKVKSATFTSG